MECGHFVSLLLLPFSRGRVTGCAVVALRRKVVRIAKPQFRQPFRAACRNAGIEISAEQNRAGIRF